MTSIAILTDEIKSLRSRVTSLERQLRSKERISATERVVTYLRYANLGEIRFDDMAESFHMSGKVLRSRLAEEGSSYRVLIDNERKHRVEEELAANPDASCIVLAEVAGYSEHQNLTRSFPKWFGKSLSEYKRGAMFTGKP